MVLVRIEDLLNYKDLDKELEARLQKYSKGYVFLDKSTIPEFQGLKFSGIVPDEDFLEFMFQHLSNLNISGNLSLIFADEKEMERISGRHPEARFLESLGAPAKPLIQEFRRIFTNAGDVFFPGPNGEALLVVNITYRNTKDAFLEGLFHYLTFKEGWLDVLHQVHDYYYPAVVITHLDHKFIHQLRETIGELFWHELAAQKGYTDLVKRSVYDFIASHKKISPEEIAESEFGSFLLAVRSSGETTLPKVLQEDEIAGEVKAFREWISTCLHPKVRDEYPQIQELFSKIKIPPEEENLKTIYKSFLDLYTLPD